MSEATDYVKTMQRERFGRYVTQSVSIDIFRKSILISARISVKNIICHSCRSIRGEPVRKSHRLNSLL